MQVHTADHPDSRLNRLGSAVEPMTCPPDAFNSGRHLITLPIGGSTTVEWQITGFLRRSGGEPRSGQWGCPANRPYEPVRRCDMLSRVRPPSRTPATARGMVGVGGSGGDGAAHQRYEVTLTATALQFSRSEMIDLRVLGPGCFGWTNRPDPRAVTTTTELLRPFRNPALAELKPVRRVWSAQVRRGERED